MALSNEDKKDVKGAMGKALANKVAKVTRDKKPKIGNFDKAFSRHSEGLTESEHESSLSKYFSQRKRRRN